jgi:hypothetical protein
MNCLGEILTEKSAKYDPHYINSDYSENGKQRNQNKVPETGLCF